MIEFKDYELDEELTIGLYCFKVSLTSATKNYFLAGTGWDVEKIFQDLKVDKYSYIQSIVGYESKGAFPETETLEDLNKVIKQLQIDYLIKEAKEKYPVGTVFKSIFNKFNYISSGKFQWLYEKQLIRDIEVYGVVWGQNEWAEIITEEPKQPEINTYGLSVGDELPFNILNEWALAGDNRYQENEYLGWRMCNSGFIYDRKIKSFKVIDGTVGFLVPGTNEVYLRAEGFKEFAESFDKPKFEVGKWYKCEGYNYAIKYLKKEVRNSKYAIVYSDIITHDDRYESFPEGSTGVGYVDEGTWYELTDLSEIQQYLPDNHPDKIKAHPEYIVGKWYKMGEWIAKFSSLNKDQFWCSISGTPHDNYKHCEYGVLSISRHGIPELITDMTEVYKLFPEEKPNDPKSDSLNYKFKVGDIVEIIKSGSGYREECLGEQVTILKLGEYNNNPGYKTTRTLGFSNANSGYWDGMADEKSFKLIRSYDDDDFEVNDWVVVERLPRYNNLSLPQTSTIFQVNKSRATPYAVTLTDKDGGIFYFRKEELRFATPEEVDKELERRWLARGERAAVFSDPGEGVVFENKPIILKSNQADPIVLEDQQVPELTITIKTNKTNKLFINPIKTITL